MSRDTMRGLKAKVEEEKRLQGIKERVSYIYSQAVATAKGYTETSYNFPIPFDMSPQPKRTIQVAQAPQKMIASKKEAVFDAQMASYQAAQAAQQGRPSDPFYIQNMPDILSGLQTLFPECKVSHTLLSQGTDGKFYDISTLDEKSLPFVNRALDQSFIVIDWS
jgi:hypothetical protein